MILRKAGEQDRERVRALYWRIIDSMDTAPYGPGWKKGIYPTDGFISDAIRNRELYLLEEGQEPVAVMVLNHQWTQGYERAEWAVQAEREQITMIHALGIVGSYQGKGLGKLLVREALKIAGENGQKAVRLDVLRGNIPAQRLYESMGFQYRGTLKLYYEDTGLTDYLLYEFLLEDPEDKESIELRNIDRSNYQECIRLQIDDSQQGFVADNTRSLVEAAYEEGLYTLGIYEKDTMVGFLLYDHDDTIPGWSLSRFMIGKQYQGKGYGKKGVRAFLDHFQKKHDADKIYISVSLDNKVARKMYEDIGFREIREIEYTYDGILFREMQMVKEL